MASANPRTAAIRRVATGTGATLVLTAAAVGVAAPAQAADVHYTVQRGDTVGAIAARTGASVASIAAANALANPSYIRVGQVLTIPSRATVPAAAPVAAAVPVATRYTVAAGDTVSRIAATHGTTVAALAAANGLANPSLIHIGQVLTVPGAAAAPAPAAAAPAAVPNATYTVASGDTLGRIATKFGTTVAALASANGLTNPSFIRIGQVLSVPGAAAAPVAASPAAVPTTITTRTSYTVTSGDTLIGIAAKYGTTAAAIQSANGLKSTLIRIGQVLSVPVTATATPLVGASFAGRTYPASVVAAANANRATLLAIGVPTKDQIRALVVTTAKSMGVDPALALAVSYQESGFDQSQVSPANAIGAMQVIPSSGQWAGDLVGRQLNLLDARDNVTAGVVILKALLRTAPDLPTAIAGYYQGATSVQQNGMFSDTKQYVANVRALMTRFA
jgi:LysM repeat protein